MKVGYARTSTLEQIAGLEGQLRDLKNQGCEEIYKEHCSAIGARQQLELALQFVRPGDTFVVTHVDRLARDVKHLLSIVERLKEKGVALKIIGLDLDTSTPHGQLLLTLVGTIAEWERKIMLERQREGIDKARRECKYKGAAPLPPEIKQAVVKYAKTQVSKPWIAKRVGIGVASIYRIIHEHNKAAQNPDDLIEIAASYERIKVGTRKEITTTVGYR